MACAADRPRTSVPGRLLYTRLTRPGVRPRALSLFTTLTDAMRYPLADLVARYGDRWQVEPRYRDLKTTLGRAAFNLRSTHMFQRELAVGLLAYTLIRRAMRDAAPTLPAARRLAFAACRRRVRDQGWQPARATRRQTTTRQRFRQQLAAYRIPHQRHKAPYEPRAVRRTPQTTFPALNGPRAAARQANLAALGAISS